MENTEKPSRRNDLLLGIVIGALAVAVIALSVALFNKDKEEKEVGVTSPVQVDNGTKDDREEIVALVNRWCESLSGKGTSTLFDIYGPQVRYYQSDYSGERVVSTKQKALEKAGNYAQNASDFRFEERHDGTYRVYFTKNTVSGQKADSYPAYLGVQKMGGEWRIIEESDLVTDKNLAQKRLAKMEKLAEDNRFGYYSELVKEGDGDFDLDDKKLYRYDKETYDIRYLLTSGDDMGTELTSLHTGEKGVVISAMENIDILSATRIVITGCPDLRNNYSFIYDTDSGKCVMIMADYGFSEVRKENGQDVIVAIERDYGDDGPELVEKIFDMDGKFLRYGKKLGPMFVE